ncbi:19122_t:CDS:2 [Entrophospora sp. SA101]|nr:14233_t:CDS:2 [Entrophospora sp. SA101]CAJ0762675.1 19122_t:CDS:2 [Entrophospora sp. SA101]
MTSSLTQGYNLRNKKDINYNYGRVLKRRHRKSKPVNDNFFDENEPPRKKNYCLKCPIHCEEEAM